MMISVCASTLVLDMLAFLLLAPPPPPPPPVPELDKMGTATATVSTGADCCCCCCCCLLLLMMLGRDDCAWCSPLDGDRGDTGAAVLSNLGLESWRCCCCVVVGNILFELVAVATGAGGLVVPLVDATVEDID